jgi:hypothetical protein
MTDNLPTVPAPTARALNLFSIVRALLAALGGVLVQDGLINADQSQQLAGALALVIVIGWSIYKNLRGTATLRAAMLAAPVALVNASGKPVVPAPAGPAGQ